MEYHNVAVADGPLPAYAQCRASAHIRERSRALTLIAPENCLPPDGQFLKHGIVEDPAAEHEGRELRDEGREGNGELLPLPQSLLSMPEEPTPIPLLLNSNHVEAHPVSRITEDASVIAPEGEVLEWPEEVSGGEEEFSSPPPDYEFPEAPLPPQPEFQEDEPLSGKSLSLELIKPASARFDDSEEIPVPELAPPPGEEKEELPLEAETWEIP